MPLKDHYPQIDDRRYGDIMDEVRTRIARYTPEWQPVWTDLNDNDPGITMVQVFAWLSDLLLYRMARVPELNYLKFLELLGVELNAAEPAQVELTFPIKPKHAAPLVIIPQHTQVSAQSPEGGPPLIFETERALTAFTARLESLVAFDGYAYTSVSAENEDAQAGFLPFGGLARQESALLLGFAYDKDSPLAQFPQAELDLMVWTAGEAAGRAPAYQCGLPAAPSYAPAALCWEYWNAREWVRMNVLKDDTLSFTRSGHVRVKTPMRGAMPLAVLAGELQPRFWMRARVASDSYEKAPRLLAVRANTASARQAETIQDETLGGSSGRRSQVFRLANAPVLAGSVRLEVDEGSGFEPWQAVSDFFGSGPDDAHYLLNRASGEIRFGDGLNGRIPVGNVENPGGNVVAREYRFGGGRRGNVPAKAVAGMVTPVAGVDDGKVGNLFAAYSGRDEETLDEAKKRAPRDLKNRCRAVTGEDFEALAMQAANVRRAKALPLFHPSFPGVQVPGVISVIVVPDSAEPAPMPSEGTLRSVCAYLDQRRLLTSEVYVIRPAYQTVEIQAEVVAGEEADLAEVSEAVQAALLDYFHPLRGGEDGLGWPFGGTIFYSRVSQRVFAVPGVRSVTRLVILLNGEEAPECRDVPIQENGLLTSGEHEIQVRYDDAV